MEYLFLHITDGIKFIVDFLTLYSYSLFIIFLTMLLSGFLAGFLTFNYIKR